MASLLDSIQTRGHSFGLFLDFAKCEVFWPSGDTELSKDILRTVESTGGIELLGSPLYSSEEFFITTVAKRTYKVLELQKQLPSLDNPQLEIHLLHSCLGICKINHVLRTVPPGRFGNIEL